MFPFDCRKKSSATCSPCLKKIKKKNILVKNKTKKKSLIKLTSLGFPLHADSCARGCASLAHSSLLSCLCFHSCSSYPSRPILVAFWQSARSDLDEMSAWIVAQLKLHLKKDSEYRRRPAVELNNKYCLQRWKVIAGDHRWHLSCCCWRWWAMRLMVASRLVAVAAAGELKDVW